MRWMTRKLPQKPSLTMLPVSTTSVWAKFDADVNLLNCKNGTLDLKTMKFRSHNPDDKITKIADVVLRPQCKMPPLRPVLDRSYER